MNAGRAKKIRQMIGYDVGADHISDRKYHFAIQGAKKGITATCLGIRKEYRQFKKQPRKVNN